MPSLQLSNLIRGPLSRMSIVTSVPLSLLLLGLQGMTDVKFTCPCKCQWNKGISYLILMAPTIIALVIMLFLLKPFTYESECKMLERISSCKENNSDTSQGQVNEGTSQGEDKKDISQSQKNEPQENLSRGKVILACVTPSLVWICLWFIDGDYLACAKTTWEGHYTCDKELHSHCLNWCKPDKLSQGKNETEYEDTRWWISTSKIIGYSLAISFSVLMAIVVLILDCCKSGKSPCCRQTDPESQRHVQQDPGPENQQGNNKPQTDNIENATEDDKLVATHL